MKLIVCGFEPQKQMEQLHIPKQEPISWRSSDIGSEKEATAWSVLDD